MSGRRSEKEEKLLERIIETDGIKKIQDAIVLVAGTEVDVTSRAARELGIIYGDVGRLLQRATTRDAIVQLRHGGTEINPRLVYPFTLVDSIRDGDFEENGLDMWRTFGTVTLEETIVYSGKKACRLAPGAYIEQDYPHPFPTEVLLPWRGSVAGYKFNLGDKVYLDCFYTDNTSSSGQLSLPNVGVWQPNDTLALWTANKRVRKLRIRSDSGNVGDILVDYMWYYYPTYMELSDNYARQLGIVRAKQLDSLGVENIGAFVNTSFEIVDPVTLGPIGWILYGVTGSDTNCASDGGRYSVALIVNGYVKQFISSPIHQSHIQSAYIAVKSPFAGTAIRVTVYTTFGGWDTDFSVSSSNWEFIDITSAFVVNAIGIKIQNISGYNNLRIDGLSICEYPYKKDIFDYLWYLEYIYGNGIAAEFDKTITRDANGRITQIVITDNIYGATKTTDITRDANGRITAENETVT